TDPLGLLDNPGTPCSTRSKGPIDGIIGEDGNCYEALGGDNSVTIHGDDKQEVIIIITPSPINSLVRGGGGGGGRNGSNGNGPSNNKDTIGFVACVLDAALNAGIGLLPGGGIIQAVLTDYLGLNLNLFQYEAGRESLISGPGDPIDVGKIGAAAYKDVS